jgi:hypothetical protein
VDEGAICSAFDAAYRIAVVFKVLKRELISFLFQDVASDRHAHDIVCIPSPKRLMGVDNQIFGFNSNYYAKY